MSQRGGTRYQRKQESVQKLPQTLHQSHYNNRQQKQREEVKHQEPVEPVHEELFVSSYGNIRDYITKASNSLQYYKSDTLKVTGCRGATQYVVHIVEMLRRFLPGLHVIWTTTQVESSKGKTVPSLTGTLSLKPPINKDVPGYMSPLTEGVEPKNEDQIYQEQIKRSKKGKPEEEKKEEGKTQGPKNKHRRQQFCV